MNKSHPLVDFIQSVYEAEMSERAAIIHQLDGYDESMWTSVMEIVNEGSSLTFEGGRNKCAMYVFFFVSMYEALMWRLANEADHTEGHEDCVTHLSDCRSELMNKILQILTD